MDRIVNINGSQAYASYPRGVGSDLEAGQPPRDQVSSSRPADGANFGAPVGLQGALPQPSYNQTAVINNYSPNLCLPVTLTLLSLLPFALGNAIGFGVNRHGPGEDREWELAWSNLGNGIGCLLLGAAIATGYAAMKARRC